MSQTAVKFTCMQRHPVQGRSLNVKVTTAAQEQGLSVALGLEQQRCYKRNGVPLKLNLPSCKRLWKCTCKYTWKQGTVKTIK